MPVQFKGVTEYQQRFKAGRLARSRSASPHCRPRLAGLRSDQLGISREPQFLSRRKMASQQPQVSRSLQWDATSDPAPQRRVTTPSPARPAPAPAPAAAPAPVRERPQTPPAPRGPRPPEPQGTTSADLQSRAPTTTPPPCALNGQSRSSRPPLAAVEGQQSAGNGVQQVLRRKAGLRSAGQKAGLHKSEYRRQFLWKTPVAGSPLLDAEQMLYTSGRTVPPFKSNPLAMESEYRRNFKGSPPPRGPQYRRDLEQGCEVPLFQQENVSPEKAAKSKEGGRRRRKKKDRDEPGRKSSPRRDPLPPPQESAQQEVRSHSPQKAGLSPGGQRKMKSEYNSNFRSPLNYRYEDGAWVKSSTAGEEVRELREKAAAYRRRAWGTHFSRLHLNQIQSEQNQLWELSTPSDPPSTPSDPQEPRPASTLSPSIQALDLARVCSSSSAAASVVSTASSIKGSTRGGAGDKPPEPPSLPVQRTLAWGEDEDGRGPGEEEEEDGEREDRETEDEVVEAADSLSSEEGRLPTPQLKVRAVQRTHHDRTTPATGGAILVSPPRQRKTGGWVRRSEPPLGKPHSPYKHLGLLPHRDAHKAEGRPPSHTSPTAGVTTVDPLPLREDSWSGQSPPADPPPAPVASKPLPSREQVTGAGPRPRPSLAPPANGIQGTLRDPEFQHNGIQGTLRDPEFQHNGIQGTLRDPEFQHNGDLGLRMCSSVCPGPGCSDEDDRLSVMSWRSASSCSVASALLERAQKRREDFWGKR